VDISQAQGVQASPPAGGAARKSDILGKDDFLRLLITQLSNQDPLAPMQNEQFVAQLAQFSSLEQMQNINDKLEASIQTDMLLSQALNNSLVTTLIGKEVKVQGDTFSLGEQGEVVGGFQIGEASASTTVEIRDAAGQVVRTLTFGGLPAGDHVIRWDGKDANGNRLAAGDYTFVIKSLDAEGEELPVISYVRGTITGVRYDQGAAFLLMGGSAYPLGNVIEILQPA
jgi:flagellar basal-body rod modification protein FlgD